MKKQDLAKKLSELSGKTVKYEGKELIVKGFTIEQSTFTLYTDDDNIVGLNNEVDIFLRKIQPSQHTLANITMKSQLQLPPEMTDFFKNMAQVAKSNIEKVQENRDYIPQAMEVRENLNTMIDMAKTQVAFMKIMQNQ